MSAHLGVSESGDLVTIDLHRHHTLLSGASGAGKSNTAYVVGAAAASDPSVRVVGCDPSSVLLAPHRAASPNLIALGTGDMHDHLRVLEAVASEMDARTSHLLASGVDLLELGGEPTILVVLEELAGIKAAAVAQDAAGGARGGDRIAPLIDLHLGRILREGRKVRVLALAILQRADAAILAGDVRAQFGRRIVFRQDNRDGVRMVYEAADDTAVERLMNVQPGVGLIWEAGSSPKFFRAARLDYRSYVAAVDAAARA